MLKLILIPPPLFKVYLKLCHLEIKKKKFEEVEMCSQQFTGWKCNALPPAYKPDTRHSIFLSAYLLRCNRNKQPEKKLFWSRCLVKWSLNSNAGLMMSLSSLTPIGCHKGLTRFRSFLIPAAAYFVIKLKTEHERKGG